MRKKLYSAVVMAAAIILAASASVFASDNAVSLCHMGTRLGTEGLLLEGVAYGVHGKRGPDCH